MGESQKVDELLQKLKSLGDRAKSTRSQLGSPLVDRLFDRVDKLSSRLPQNGDSRSQQQPPQAEVRRTCPKCGRSFSEDVAFCNCGYSFRAQEIEERHQREDRERLERNSRASIIS